MHGTPELLIGLAVSLSVAFVLGFLTERIGLSPIVGYLLAGIAIGPQTPGFVADQATAAQFAEIGVVLLMFGVGMQFHLKDLLAMRRIAIPGALGQILLTSAAGLLVMAAYGQRTSAGLVVGLAVSVASTVVLVRVLMANDVLRSSQGQIAIGWLVVEDLFTVLVLVALPALATALSGGELRASQFATQLLLAIGKVAALAVVVLVLGGRAIPHLLRLVARTRSRELFVLAILAVALGIALTSATVFGVSMALGAFLAGLIVGQSEVSHQAAADALPMRDAFAVLFFVSVGMLFDPNVVIAHPGLFTTLLGVVLIAKPLAALALVWLLGYSLRTGLTAAIGLAQIGEFSFILAELGVEQHMISADVFSLLVACSLLSIAANPLLFRLIPKVEAWLHRHPKLWRSLSKRSERLASVSSSADGTSGNGTGEHGAVIVGYGPVGRAVCSVLKEFDLSPLVIDMNVDTVRTLRATGHSAIYGDATRHDILEAAGLRSARYLLLTIPDLLTRGLVVMTAREVNPDINVIVRARYLQERAWLEEVGATNVCYEEVQAAIGLTQVLLREIGASEDRIEFEARKIHQELVGPALPPGGHT